jgi:hypothetical protein
LGQRGLFRSFGLQIIDLHDVLPYFRQTWPVVGGAVALRREKRNRAPQVAGHDDDEEMEPDARQSIDAGGSLSVAAPGRRGENG